MREDDRRASPRHRVAIDVEVAHGAGIVQRCVSRDFSLGGLFLDAPVHLAEVGAELELCFLLPGDGEHRRRARARVVRRVEEGMGLAFTRQDVVAFRALQEILARGAASGHARPDA